MEVWKAVVGWEGLYEVSSMGNVRSLDRDIPLNGGIAHKKGKLLHTYKQKNGYMCTHLYGNGKHATVSIHQLVANAFIPKPKDKCVEVNHINCIRHDNRVENLEWLTHFENQQATPKKHYGKVGHENYMAVHCGSEHHSARAVLQMDMQGNVIAEHKTITAASVATGIEESQISLCVRGAHKYCKGYKWAYKEKDCVPKKYRNTKRIAQLNDEKKVIKVWERALDITRELGINLSSVYLCVQGKRKRAGGYYWQEV
jgi:hypothetical protein